MGKRRAKHCPTHQKPVFDKNGFEIYDFDPAKDMDSEASLYRLMSH